MESFQKSVTFNAIGASAIVTGDFSYAIDALAVAFKLARVVLVDATLLAEKNQQEDEQGDYSSRVTTNRRAQHETTTRSAFKFSMQQWNNTPLHLHGLSCISVGATKSDEAQQHQVLVLQQAAPPSYDTAMTHSISVVFNLALAHHLSAIDEERDTEKRNRLMKAAKLYEYVLGLMRTRQVRGHCDSTNTTTVLLLATLNNVGLAYDMILGKDTTSQQQPNQYFERMLSILMYLVANAKHDTLIRSVMDSSELRIIFFSTKIASRLLRRHSQK